MISRIIVNTPVWVWGIFLILLMLGLTQARARSISLRRLFIVPIILIVMSTWGTISSFGFSPLVLLAWLIAASLTIWLVIQRPASTLIKYDIETGLFHLPGSWIPLVMMMGIFSVKYVVGVALAIDYTLATSAEFSATASALYGSMTGVFIGRVRQIWKLKKES